LLKVEDDGGLCWCKQVAMREKFRVEENPPR
jgi:hypothetical protein